MVSEMSIKSKLVENENIRYIVRFFKNLRNARVVYDSNRLYSNPQSVFIDHKGDKNTGRLVMPIIVDSAGWGFGAGLRYVLAGLWYADECGFTPVVEYTLNSLYAQEPGFMGTNNPFEYFFEPITLEDWKNSRAIVRTKGFTPEWEDDRVSTAQQCMEAEYGNTYNIPDEYTKRLGVIWKKYISLNKASSEQVYNTAVYNRIKEKKTVGVHVRGTDYNAGIKGHPVKVDETEHVKLVKKLLETEGYEQVFIASDESGAIEYFRSVFGERVFCYSDVLRSSDGEPVHFSKNKREAHHYLLGIEILKDMYALAACDGFVGGISQISNCVRILKSSAGEKYINMELIDHGINLR